MNLALIFYTLLQIVSAAWLWYIIDYCEEVNLAHHLVNVRLLTENYFLSQQNGIDMIKYIQFMNEVNEHFIFFSNLYNTNPNAISAEIQFELDFLYQKIINENPSARLQEILIKLQTDNQEIIKMKLNNNFLIFAGAAITGGLISVSILWGIWKFFN